MRLGLVFSLAFLLGCQDQPSTQVIDVTLAPSELFEHPTVGGIEDGARLVRQAEHFAVSEIRRNADTDFVAVYTYQPAVGYIGADRAEIEVSTGSDGASAPTRVTRIVFRFSVRE